MYSLQVFANCHVQSNVEVTVKKTVNQLYIYSTALYLEQQLNVNSTMILQWKVGHMQKV